MEIKGKVHCFFEQSGTFKQEFIKLGIPAEDYDIQNNFGQTDHMDDLFKEIEVIIVGTLLSNEQSTTDIDAFVREWDETICSKTIQNTSTDGIRILSIHKSKGLEFDHVLIPFCDWRLEHSDILWCQPKESPFDALPIVPVDYSAKQMMGTIYEPNYLDEHLQNTVDNLNLLYVAFM